MEDRITSPLNSTNSIIESNKSDSGKSPSKCKKSINESSTNLDKVIEAVSKGILDEFHNSNADLDSNSIEIKPLKSPKVNGIQAKLNDSKSPTRVEKSSPESKLKANKKSKKEKEKEKDKDKDKEKDKDKDKEKGKEKTKIKEKTKRKEKLKQISDPNSSQTIDQEIKEEKLIPDEIQPAKQCMVEKNVCENSVEHMKLDISIGSSNTSEMNTSKDTQPLSSENSINRDASKEQNVFLNGKIEKIESAITPTKPIDPEVERKQSRKRRKEKHRNKHGPDSERSSSKEHKKKRKRKSHDHENPESFPLADGVPKIKIKVQTTLAF